MVGKKAIIIGAGIAGPVMALFLKCVGIDADVYEARSAQDNEGSFLNMAANGLTVLKTLGLNEVVEAEGSPVPRMIMSNSQGKTLGEVRNGARAGLTESVTIKRPRLHELLRQSAAEQGITIHFSKKLVEIETHAAGVRAVFADGSEANGDFLIGCDGVHSRTRQLMNPAAPKPTFTGLISTGGFTTGLNLPPTPKIQHFIFGKRAFFGYHVRSSGEIYWFNNFGQDEEPARDALGRISHNEWKARLLAMHEGDLPLINDIIRATTEGIVGYTIYDIATQPQWYSDRVVLVGDAVHAVSPSSGQGTSLALEDAAVLAKCLRDSSSLEEAFSRYVSLRRERVEKTAVWARRFGNGKTVTNPIGVWMRDLMMPFFLKFSANPTALDWVYDYSIDWDMPVK